jgi:hypothetical protein
MEREGQKYHTRGDATRQPWSNTKPINTPNFNEEKATSEASRKLRSYRLCSDGSETSLPEVFYFLLSIIFPHLAIT